MKRFVVLVALLVSSGYASAGRTLTLEECRELAIQNNKELKISGEKIKMAGYEKNAAFTKYFPQLSATGAYMWNQKDINLLDMGALSTSIGGALGPIAQLPVFGKLMEGVDDLQHLESRISGGEAFHLCSLCLWEARLLITTRLPSTPSNWPSR